MKISNNGNVGIGIMNPVTELHVHDNSLGSSMIKLTNQGSGGTIVDGLSIIQGGGHAVIQSYEDGYISLHTVDGNFLRLERSGNVHGTYGNYHTASDERLKKHIATIENALEKISRLRGVNFIWKDGSDNESLQMGMVAQEVEKVVPEVVHTADDEMNTMAVEYQYLVGLLVEAVKELKSEKDAEIATLKTENRQLRETFTSIADRQKSIEDMLLALSATPSKEKLVKLADVQ